MVREVREEVRRASQVFKDELPEPHEPCNAEPSYVSSPHMPLIHDTRELKKGSAELLILSLVEARPRHGYDIAKRIESASEGTLTFHAASLYPLLYRLERRGWIEGKWHEQAGQRRRRMYKITRDGRKVLVAQRSGWLAFVRAVNSIAGGGHA